MLWDYTYFTTEYWVGWAQKTPTPLNQCGTIGEPVDGDRSYDRRIG